MENQMIYSIHDMKAHANMQPWFLPNDELAVRAFGDCVNDPEHNFGRHPEDYVLQQVGIWKPNKGTIEALDTAQTICTGLELLKGQAA